MSIKILFWKLNCWISISFLPRWHLNSKVIREFVITSHTKLLTFDKWYLHYIICRHSAFDYFKSFNLQTSNKQHFHVENKKNIHALDIAFAMVLMHIDAISRFFVELIITTFRSTQTYNKTHLLPSCHKTLLGY